VFSSASLLDSCRCSKEGSTEHQTHGKNSYHYAFKSHDSSVGIALGYRLDDRGSSVRFLVGAGNFSLHH
jgi:hypothetical protein